MIATTLFVSGVLLQLQALKSNERPCPYVVVTAAGERIGSLDLPKRDEKPVKFRMCVNATLTMLPAADVDWGATEKANASGPAPVPTPGFAPTPTRQALSSIANKIQLRDAEGIVKQNEGGGKLITASGKEFDFQRHYFGKESVAQYLALGTFLADTSTCPASRAVAYGVVRNISQMKLRDLRAYVVIGSQRTGQNNGQIQSMDPSSLMPGEEAKVFLYLSCSFVRSRETSSSHVAEEPVAVLLPDVGGKPER